MTTSPNPTTLRSLLKRVEEAGDLARDAALWAIAYLAYQIVVLTPLLHLGAWAWRPVLPHAGTYAHSKDFAEFREWRRALISQQESADA